MSTATLNGKPQRKQLSDQLDRLDGIIDALADALPEAVRDAVHDGTKTALHQLIVETLTNPSTLAMIRQAVNAGQPQLPTNVVPQTPSIWNRGKNWLGEKLNAMRVKLRSLREKCQPLVVPLRAKLAEASSSLMTAKARVGSWLSHINILWKFKRILAVSLAVGTLVLSVSLFSHSTATVLASIGTTISLVCVQLGLLFQRTARRITD
jgi:hypothetical protein